MFIASIPRKVRLALLNEANPIPVFVNRAKESVQKAPRYCSNISLAEALSSQVVVHRLSAHQRMALMRHSYPR